MAAVTKLTADFDTTVSFGLMTFPAASNECGPGDLKVPIDLGTGADIAMVLKNTTPGGGTPTGETLQAALKLFEDNPVGADTVAPVRYVLLVTDGQPTCPNGKWRWSRRLIEADKKFTTDALDALTAAGIKTFVVGYDAALDPTFGDALTEFAQHGGTDHYYPVQDENSLTEAFKSISETVITCALYLQRRGQRPALGARHARQADARARHARRLDHRGQRHHGAGRLVSEAAGRQGPRRGDRDGVRARHLPLTLRS